MGERLSGRVALITGGGTGIGYATAEALLDEGARVVIAGHLVESLDDAAASLGQRGSCEKVLMDVTDAEQVQAGVENVVRTHERIDILVNCAGVLAAGQPYWQVSETDWDTVFAVNLRGPWLLARSVAPHMMAAGRGTIINVASQLAFSAVANFGAYPVAKAGLVHLGHCLALELIPHGVRVNTVCPGGTGTAYLHSSFEGSPSPSAGLDDLIARHPIGRLATPSEIAAAIAFLASDDSSFMVGSDLVVDGGYVL
jgi:meso-butanediol dehydrogenase/(S,S)-butanediol dehydrogenase/diacetyl reductase